MRYPIALLGATLAGPALADAPNVVAGTPVVHSLVEQVMGDLGSADLILDQGGDPHSFQMRPSHARALEQADLVFWVGPELTPWLQRALDGSEGAASVISLLAADGVTLRDYAHGHDHGHDDHGHDHDHDDHGHDHDHDDHGHDHGHDDHGHDHGHDDHGHDHGHDHSHDGTDPHAWLDTGNAAVWLDAIAQELAHADPGNADTYRANAAAAREALTALEADIRSTLEPVGDAPLVMFHDAYGYFAAQFGVNVAGTIALGDAAAPGAARIAELRQSLAEDGAVCIFPEVQHSSRYVDVVVEGTGVRVGEMLDPSGSAMEPGAALYGDMMRNLADAIADCVTDAG